MINLEKEINDNSDLIKEINSILLDYKPHFNEVLLSDKQLEAIVKAGEAIASSSDQLCIVGLGGSSLGTKALYESLGSTKDVIFFDNVDAYNFEKNYDLVNPDNCHWLFVSKSGGTKEVLCLIDMITQKYKEFDFKQCSIITDDRKSILLDWGKENNIKITHLPLEIGGRFSVFTAVGLIPLVFMGKDLQDVVKGVSWGLNQTELIAKICSGLIDSFSREEWVHLYWIYSDSLQGFGDWLQQLWMESLGKKNNLNGDQAPRVSSLFTARGASDQHSILQQVSDGAKDKLIVFLSDSRAVDYGDKFKSSNFPCGNELLGFGLGKLCLVEMQSTYEALSKNGVSTNLLFLNEVTTKSLSALMTIYMASTVIIASYLNINPFDQPGVESSKQRTKEILSRLNSEN